MQTRFRTVLTPIFECSSYPPLAINLAVAVDAYLNRVHRRLRKYLALLLEDNFPGVYIRQSHSLDAKATENPRLALVSDEIMQVRDARGQ